MIEVMGHDWQFEPENAALMPLTFRPDFSTVEFHELLADGQTETRTAPPLTLFLMKHIKNLLHINGRNTDARIGNLVNNVIFLTHNPDTDLTSIGKTDGVTQQIEQHLPDSHLVCPDCRQLRLNLQP